MGSQSTLTQQVANKTEVVDHGQAKKVLAIGRLALTWINSFRYGENILSIYRFINTTLMLI